MVPISRYACSFLECATSFSAISFWCVEILVSMFALLSSVISRLELFLFDIGREFHHVYVHQMCCIIFYFA